MGKANSTHIRADKVDELNGGQIDNVTKNTGTEWNSVISKMKSHNAFKYGLFRTKYNCWSHHIYRSVLRRFQWRWKWPYKCTTFGGEKVVRAKKCFGQWKWPYETWDVFGSSLHTSILFFLRRCRNSTVVYINKALCTNCSLKPKSNICLLVK